MTLRQHQLTIETRGQGLYEFTGQVARWITSTGLREGQLTVFLRHTSASLLVQENADRDVQRDLLAFFQRLVPENDSLYVHTLEGPDDMPAHVKAALTSVHLTIPVMSGQMVLGTWQGIYVFEHRTQPHRRNVVLSLLGE